MLVEQISENVSNYEIEQELSQVRTGYLQLDKRFGFVEPATLIDIAQEMSCSDRPTDIAIAASAITEAFVTGPRPTLEELDEYLAWLDWSAELYAQAERGFWQELDRGWRHPQDQTDLLRTQLNGLFLDVYRDIICGEITTQTSAETSKRLAQLAKYTQGLLKRSHGRMFELGIGFAYELASIIAIHNSADSLIALPTTPRTENGEYNQQLSHDLIISQLHTDEHADLWLANVEALQLKGRVTTEDLERYDTTQIILIDVHEDLGLNAGNIYTALSPYQQSGRKLLNDVFKALQGAYYVRPYNGYASELLEEVVN